MKMSKRVQVGVFWNVYASRFGYRVPSNVDHMLSKWTPEARDEAIQWTKGNMDPHKIEVHEVRVYDIDGKRTAESELTTVFEVTPTVAQPAKKPHGADRTVGGRKAEQLELAEPAAA
ncbi:hypothetical protein ACH4TX_41815 [Streptomyces sp. NPDC021098]|uniref:hypothetical protein n=1 Tax=unclassified Streptomyces TaxID=2593676 RepID=UPI0037BDD8F0